MALFVSKDDVRFHAILKRGPLVSSAEKTYVRIDDVCMKHAFQMTVLQSSALEDVYPSFGTTGLLGTWILKDNLLSFESLATDYALLVKENVEPFTSLYTKVFDFIQRS